MNARSMFGLIAILACGPVTAQEATPPTLPRISEAMESAIRDGEVAGVVTLVGTRDGIVHLSSAGKADLETGRPMEIDSIFWIASMTKPITAVAVLMMQDEGRLSVDDPVSRYIPEFEALKTREGSPATITIKQLLTHTSGLGEISPEEARQCKTLASAVALYVTKPVAFQPGEKWVYSQSSINTAARIVEIVSGQNFADFLRDRLFEPLGMKDTTFYLEDKRLSRLATSYSRNNSGRLEPTPIRLLGGARPTDRDRFPAANGGLFSTAPDYAKFCQMLLNGGLFDGKRYLSADAVKQMTTVQTGDLVPGFTPGNGWGLGCCVVRQPQGASEVLSPGSFGHGGAYGTQAWIDPVKGRYFVLMVQRANFANADDSDLRRSFQKAAAEDLDN